MTEISFALGGAAGAVPPSAAAAIAAIALALMLLEFLAARLERRDSHDLQETLATGFIALGGPVAKLVFAGLAAAPYYVAHQYRLFDLPIDSVWAALALFLGMEFCYYWMHRASHTVRWMWATHRVHHSATKFNLTAALRLGWTGALSGLPLFFLPLVWIGFPPLAVVAAVGLNLLYQFILHTERPISFGPLEWILNTPTHHRAHHASNDGCLDKNYGGVLIVFDRLFGTFVAPPAEETLYFGLKGAERTDNPLRILFDEWLAIARDAGRARSTAALGRALFGPPK